MTASFLGTLSKDKAPVEDTIFFSSISIPGNEDTVDPVAITIFLDLTLVLLLLSEWELMRIISYMAMPSKTTKLSNVIYQIVA